MKIIKQGKGKKKSGLFTRVNECEECGCKFSLENEKEAKLVRDDRDGDFYKIKCPQCGHVDNYDVSLFD